MPERPDLRAHAVLADERVVLRHGAVGIEADDLAEQAVHALRLHAALGDRALAERDEQHAVAREHEAAAEVQRRLQRRRLMEDHLHVLDLRRGAVHEAAARHGGVVHAAVARLGVAPVDQLIGGERRVDGDVEQAALAARVHRRQTGHRLGHLLAVGAHDAQPAGPLGDEHLAVGQEREAPRVDQPFGDGLDVERDVELLLGARASDRRTPASDLRRSAAGCSCRSRVHLREGHRHVGPRPEHRAEEQVRVAARQRRAWTRVRSQRPRRAPFCSSCDLQCEGGGVRVKRASRPDSSPPEALPAPRQSRSATRSSAGTRRAPIVPTVPCPRVPRSQSLDRAAPGRRHQSARLARQLRALFTAADAYMRDYRVVIRALRRGEDRDATRRALTTMTELFGAHATGSPGLRRLRRNRGGQHLGSR